MVSSAKRFSRTSIEVSPCRAYASCHPVSAFASLGASTPLRGGELNTRELRQSARLIWEAALNAANPGTCIPKFLQLRDNILIAGGKQVEIRGRVIVIGSGKASARMAQVVEEILGSH